jgi:hypothetical protein
MVTGLRSQKSKSRIWFFNLLAFCANIWSLGRRRSIRLVVIASKFRVWRRASFLIFET